MKWDVDKADGVMWIASEAAKSLVKSMKDVCGIAFTKNLCYIKNHIFYWCTLEKENEKIGNFLVKKFKDDKFLKKFEKDFFNFHKKTINFLNEMDKTEFSKINDGKLFEILKKSNDIYIHLFDWGFIAEPMDFVLPKIFEKKFKELCYNKEEISEMMVVPYISYLSKEKQNLFKITMKNDKELLKKHAYEYRWMISAHMGRMDIPLSYFENRAKELDKEELNKLKNFKSDVEKKRKELISKKPIDEEAKELLDIIELITEVHDLRKELFLRSIYTNDTARQEIANRYRYDKEQLACFEAKDILKLKDGKELDKEFADEMSKEGLIYVDTKKKIWKYLTGKKARKFAEKEIELGKKDIKEFKGMTASPGKAKGIVKIVYGTKELNKVKKGDIIVSSMTKPEMAPALKKIVAIVTDEGGVTCHASIVSREMGIPCIIGTKIATNVLRDGDLIEVDADKGIIKKIK